MVTVTKTVDIRLPAEHPKQHAIIHHPAKRKVICAGRRGGKTTLAAMVAVDKLTEGRRVLLSSTTQDQADTFWEKCKTWCADAIAAGVIEKNEHRRTLSMPSTGGRIKVKTAWDADTLRGDYADFLVLDECAILSPAAWTEVGAPMLLDNDGDAWFISTPRGRNWFYDLYLKAMHTGGRWAAWHFTSLDNPHLSPEALAEITQDMPADAYRQEVLAEFIEDGLTVFRLADLERAEDGASGEREPSAGRSYVGAVDIGRRQDATVINVFDITTTPYQRVYHERLERVPYPVIQQRIEWAAGRYRGRWVVESNGVGDPVIENLNVKVEPFVTTSKTKVQALQALQLLLEQGRLKATWTSQERRELIQYQWDDRALQQDCVMSLAIGALAIEQPPRSRAVLGVS